MKLKKIIINYLALLIRRKEISQILKDFLELVDCHEKEVLKLALETYSNHNLDFIDSFGKIISAPTWCIFSFAFEAVVFS